MKNGHPEQENARREDHHLPNINVQKIYIIDPKNVNNLYKIIYHIIRYPTAGKENSNETPYRA